MVDRKKAERINQELQEKLCQTFQTEAAIDLACDQDRVLREHFPQVARSHREEYYHLIWKKFTSRDIWNKRKTRTTKPRQHLGHLQPRELGSWFTARRIKAGSYTACSQRVTCEARPLPLPPCPEMLPRCLRFNQCIGVDLR